MTPCAHQKIIKTVTVDEKCKNKNPDRLDSVLHDCNVLGIFYGFSLSEWSQKASDKMKPFASEDGLPLAFISPT